MDGADVQWFVCDLKRIPEALSRYHNRMETTPAAMRRTPTMRPGERGWMGLLRRPKWSMMMEASSWPAIMAER